MMKLYYRERKRSTGSKEEDQADDASKDNLTEGKATRHCLEQ